MIGLECAKSYTKPNKFSGFFSVLSSWFQQYLVPKFELGTSKDISFELDTVVV